MSEWIALWDKQPEEGQQILIFCGGCLAVATYSPELTWLFSHWLPLPEPPEGEMKTVYQSFRKV